MISCSLQKPSALQLVCNLFIERNTIGLRLTDHNGSDLVNTRGSALDVSPPVDDVTTWRGDVDRVQDGPQYLAERCGEDFRGKVGDVGGDGPARQELSHLIGEGVAVVLKQTIPVTSVCAFSKRGEVIHEDLLRNLSLAELYHRVRRTQHGAARRTAGDPLPAEEELVAVRHDGRVPDTIQLLS